MLCDQREEQRPRLSVDGYAVHQGFGTGGFAERVIVRGVSAIPVPDDVPMDVAAVMGCATATGLGAVFNIAKVEPGARVAVIGAGGIGQHVIMACRIAGASQIVVAEPNHARAAVALELGATDHSASSGEALREFRPEGFDHVFESVGRVDLMGEAVRLARKGGTATLIGVSEPGATVPLDALDLVVGQKRVLGCLTGNLRPNIDFDLFFRLYRSGALPVDRMISDHLGFADIGRAFEQTRRGTGLRTVVTIE